MEAPLCMYPSKPCSNQRSNKDDGSLHRLCAFHRQRANDAQRRWHERQRRNAAEWRTSSDSGSANESDCAPKKRRCVRAPRRRIATKKEVPNAPEVSRFPILRAASPVLVDQTWSVLPTVPLFEPLGECDHKALLEDDWSHMADFIAEMDAFLEGKRDPLAGFPIHPLEESMLFCL